MDTKKLRQKILDLAIRGKLVPQDPNDEPASVLIEKIRTGKERLIKEKKIKRDKNESYIYRSDKSYYEKFADGIVKCIDEEIPFEIPESWEWVRLNSLATFSGGKTPSTENAEYWNGEMLWVTSKDMKSYDIFDTQIKLSKEGLSQMQIFPPFTILIVVRSGILRRTLPIAILRKEATINQDLKAISLFSSNLAEFLFFSLMAFEGKILTEYSKAGTTVESINFDELKSILIPMPPLQELQRIVVAIKHCLKLINNTEQNQENLQFLVKQAKSKILDLAIRGKLVPQDPNDEPASVLFECIKAERPESKKKAKNISDNSHYKNLLFEIPENWIWLSGYECFKSMKTVKPTEKSFCYIDIDAVDNIQNIVKSPKVMLINEAPSRATREVNDGDTIFSMVRPYLRNIAYIDKTLSSCIASTGFFVCKPVIALHPRYLYYMMLSSYVVNGLNQFMKGDNSPSINNDNILSWLYPIPPYGEQVRIAEAVQNLHGLLDEASLLLQ